MDTFHVMKMKVNHFPPSVFCFCVEANNTNKLYHCDHVMQDIINKINYTIYKAHFTEKEEHSKAPVKFCQDVEKASKNKCVLSFYWKRVMLWICLGYSGSELQSLGAMLK